MRRTVAVGLLMAACGYQSGIDYDSLNMDKLPQGKISLVEVKEPRADIYVDKRQNRGDGTHPACTVAYTDYLSNGKGINEVFITCPSGFRKFMPLEDADDTMIHASERIENGYRAQR